MRYPARLRRYERGDKQRESGPIARPTALPICVSYRCHEHNAQIAMNSETPAIGASKKTDNEAERVFSLRALSPSHSPFRVFMSHRSYILFTVLLGLSTSAAAQTLDVVGYVKAENIFDTRQVLAVREGQLSLYPLEDSPASRTDNLILAAFESRIGVAAAGAEAFGAKVTALLEADFWGSVNSNVSTLRLRHAYVRLDWPRHEVLVGQYWSPLFSLAAAPQVAATSGGAPFQPFARFPQVSYTWKPGGFRIQAALSQQRDGFSEMSGNKLQQQSGLPGMHLHAEYGFGKHSIGAGSYFKSIRPEAMEARFSAWAVQGYGKAAFRSMAVRAKATYGTDLADHLMTGGFVETESGGYEALHVAAGWMDVATTGEGLAAGLFAGYLTNLGARCDVAAVSTAGTRAANMDHLWRVAPRLVFNAAPLRAAVELEATSARYAARIDSRLRPDTEADARSATNIRTLLALYYFF